MRPAHVASLLAAGLLAASAALPVVQASAAGMRPELTRSQIVRVLDAAQEIVSGKPDGEHLALFGKVVTVPDGQGGTLTAVPVVRFPTADAYGQMVLFWHGTTLIGSDQLAKLPNLGEESIQLGIVGSGTGYVTVRFQRYKPTDPMAGPSLTPVDVTYRWTQKGLEASAPVPAASGNQASMRLGATGLTRSAVNAVLAKAQETSTSGVTQGEHLVVAGKIVTVPDGFGGTLTAVPAVRFPTADGYGQLVLFWHNTTLVGSNHLLALPALGEEASQLSIVASGKGFVTVRYQCYKPSDPMYAPSLPPVDVTYTWTSQGLKASRSVPATAGNQLSMSIGG